MSHGLRIGKSWPTEGPGILLDPAELLGEAGEDTTDEGADATLLALTLEVDTLVLEPTTDGDPFGCDTDDAFMDIPEEGFPEEDCDGT